MKRFSLLILLVGLCVSPALAVLQPEAAPPPASNAPTSEAARQASTDTNTKAASADHLLRLKESKEPRTPDFLEYLVDSIVDRFDVGNGQNTTSHFVIS
ncbi:MAG: hypothetical protein ABIO94_12470, partial [Opitutaceae bacterium]